MYNKKVIIDAIRNLNKSKKQPKYNKDYTNNSSTQKKKDNVITGKNGVNAPVYKSIQIGPSKIHGKGVFSQEPIAKGDVIGVSHIRKNFTKNGQQYQAPFPSTQLGGYYNHSESPNIQEVDNKDHILLLAKRNINPGEELTSNYYNHNIDDLETPDKFKKGGSSKRPQIPSKKNSKAYSRSFEATNKFFAQNPLFKKSKSRKNKIFDPNAKYYADGGLTKFVDGGPQCPEGYTYDEATKRCVRKNTTCPEGYFYDAQEGRCKSKAYREKAEFYVKGNKTVPTEEQEEYPWYPNDLTLKEIDKANEEPLLISKQKTLRILRPDNNWPLSGFDIYPDLNYEVVADPNKPKGFNADKSIYYVPDENNFEFEKFKQYKKLKEIEKENLANVAKYPDLKIEEELDGNWNDEYLNPEYNYYSDINNNAVLPTFDEYKNAKREEEEECPDCTYGHGEKISRQDDYNLIEKNLGSVYKGFYDMPDHETRLEREYDYIDLPDEYMIPRFDLGSVDTEAPMYVPTDYDMTIPTISTSTGKTKSKKQGARLINGKGQKYKHTTYRQTKDLDFGKREATRFIPKMVQKATGYDKNFIEGYENEDGEYIPGEIERAEQEGRKINFKGASSLRDLKNQKEYERQWSEYQKQKDEVRQQNEAYLQEYGITPEEYTSVYGNFKDGGERKKRKTRWKNVTDESFPQTTRTPIDSEYLEKYPDFQPYMLNMPEVALRPRKQPTFLRRTEDTINEWLGYPMDRAAREAAQRGGKEDPVDNFRHPMAGYYTAQKIGPLGANALGILHEISTLSDPRDTRPWYNKLRESAEDIYNNNEGASLSFLPESWAKSIIGFESDNNLLPDGVSNPRGKNMYFKEDGGDIQLKLTQKEIDEYVKGGYIVEDISVPSLSNKTDIPKASFGWITKEKKVPKEPVKVDPVQDMITKISGENLGQLMDKENYDVINTLKDKEIISQTLNPMTLMTYPNLLDLATRRGIQDALTFMRSTEAKDYGISTSGTKTDLAPRDLDAIVKYDLENDKVGQALYAATHIPNTRYGQRSGLSSLPYETEYVNIFRYGEGPTDYVVANDQMTAAERVKLKTGKYPSYLKQDYLKQGTPDSLDALYTFANRNTPYVKLIKKGNFSDLYGPYKSILRYPFDYSGSASDMLQRFVDLENYTSDNSKTVDKTSGKEGAKSGDIVTDSLIDKNSRGTFYSLQGPETAVIGNPGQKVFDPVATYYKPGHLELEAEKENVYNLLENSTDEEIIDYVNDKIKQGEFSDPQTNINLFKEDPEFAQIKSSDDYRPSVYINYWVDPKTGLVNKNMDKKTAAQSAAHSYLGYLEHIKEPMIMKNTSDVIKIPYSPFRFKFEDGGEYQLGDEVDEATMQKLKENDYTFEIVK